MTSLVISFEDGGINELHQCSLEDAQSILQDEYGDEIVFGDWDADGINDDDDQCYRMLCWRNEADADNDDGKRSVAQIERVGQS